MVFRPWTLQRVNWVVRNKHLVLRRFNHNWKARKYSYAFAPGDTILSQATLGNLVDKAAEEAGDDLFISSFHQNVKKSFLQFKNEVENVAAGLIATGLKKGDRIGLWAPNMYEWILIQFATAKAGLVLVNINPAYQINELKFCLRKTQCRAVVISEMYKSQNFYKMLCSIVPELSSSKPGNLRSESVPDLHTVILIADSPSRGTFSLNDISNAGGSSSFDALNSIQGQIQFDDPVNIQFTSGTTGMPKGATLNHHNVINNALLSGKRFGYHVQKAKICCQVPLFHCFGCVIGIISSLIFQCSCILPSFGFDAKNTLHCIEIEKCTTLYGTPTMYIDILNMAENGTFDVSSLKQAVLGGAPCPADVLMNIHEKLKLKHIQMTYGMTENSPVVALSKLNDDISKVAAGYLTPLEYVEVKVINQDGKLLPIDTKGELCIRGRTLFMGYWDEQAKTDEVIDKLNWYHSGDLAEMDENGFIKIVGRLKDMVIRGGENIYPKEVEDFLHTHPWILEAHVFGVPDMRMGEELCACVKIKNGHDLTVQDIKDYCFKKISHFKIPRYIIFVGDFPKTTSGKIQKFKLREFAINKLGL